MKKILKLSLFVFLLGCLPARVCLAADDKQLTNQVESAIETFKQVDPDMAKLFKSATGYAVFPRIAKGGFVVGGAHGLGLVYQGGKLIGRATISQGTFGAQIGGQVLSEVIFFQNKETLDNFKESRLEMSAQIGAVAAAEGASKNAKYVDGVMVFTKARTGLMAEASIGGQKFKFTPFK